VSPANVLILTQGIFVAITFVLVGVFVTSTAKHYNTQSAPPRYWKVWAYALSVAATVTFLLTAWIQSVLHQ
jgi:hypothetical protein